MEKDVYLSRTQKRFMKFNLNKLIAFDTEDDSKGNILLASFYNGKNFKVFKGKNIRKKVDRYIRQHEKYFFVGLNVMYDLLSIYQLHNVLEFFNLYFGKTAFIFAKDSKKNTFFDLFWLMPYSLRQIGEIVGLNKLETDNFADETYNKRDTEITYKAAKLFLNYLNSQRYEFGFTLASISLKIFKRYYIKNNKFLRYDTETIEILRNAYYGGRTENFIRGDVYGNINVYDVNSLYPSVMANKIYPNPNTIKKDTSLHYFGIYYVEVDVKKDVHIPVLPYRADKLLFPVGHFKTWVTGVELLTALKYNQINSYTILSGFSFAKGEKYFSKFVHDIYSKRMKNENKFEKKVCKLLLNSLYGKFGQGRERTEYNGKTFITVIDENFPDNTIIPFAIFTTAFARLELFEYLHTANTRGNVYYCDTDSIHTDITFPTSKRLGAVKLEGVFNYAKYLAPKVYFMDGEGGDLVHAKGVPLEYQREFIDNLRVTFSKPNRLKESLQRGLIANEWNEIEKVFRDNRGKREFNKDGTSLPLTIND